MDTGAIGMMETAAAMPEIQAISAVTQIGDMSSTFASQKINSCNTRRHIFVKPGYGVVLLILLTELQSEIFM